MNSQQELFQLTIDQKFDAWKETAGARHVLRIAYVIAARYARRYQTTGRQVSMKLIWELMRDEIEQIRLRFAARGISLDRFEGFALNNIFTSRVARHIVAHRPEWDGMFELRECNVPRAKRKVLVITEALPHRPPVLQPA